MSVLWESLIEGCFSGRFEHAWCLIVCLFVCLGMRSDPLLIRMKCGVLYSTLRKQRRKENGVYVLYVQTASTNE